MYCQYMTSLISLGTVVHYEHNQLYVLACNRAIMGIRIKKTKRTTVIHSRLDKSLERDK